MRTTLTLDDDVARLVRRLQRKRGAKMKEIVNEALRVGLKQLEAPQPRSRFRTKAVALGLRVSNVDDVAETLALAEGDEFR